MFHSPCIVADEISDQPSHKLGVINPSQTSQKSSCKTCSGLHKIPSSDCHGMPSNGQRRRSRTAEACSCYPSMTINMIHSSSPPHIITIQSLSNTLNLHLSLYQVDWRQNKCLSRHFNRQHQICYIKWSLLYRMLDQRPQL